MSAGKSVCKSEIFVSIERGDTETVHRMTKAYPSLVSVKTSHGWTPLMFAARYGQLDIVKLLVEAGALNDNKNPLLAVQYSQFSNIEVLRYLLSKNANPNVQGLLFCAATSNPKRMDVVRLLIAHGAVYEQKYEYIDRETKQPISKIVRYNDARNELPERFILSLCFQHNFYLA